MRREPATSVLAMTKPASPNGMRKRAKSRPSRTAVSQVVTSQTLVSSAKASAGISATAAPMHTLLIRLRCSRGAIFRGRRRAMMPPLARPSTAREIARNA